MVWVWGPAGVWWREARAEAGTEREAWSGTEYEINRESPAGRDGESEKSRIKVGEMWPETLIQLKTELELETAKRIGFNRGQNRVVQGDGQRWI